MLGHDFHTQDLRLTLLANLNDDLLQSFGDLLTEHLTPVFWTPDDVVPTGVVNVPVRFVAYCTHEKQYTASGHIVSIE